MEKQQFIISSVSGIAGFITLNRPAVHNALHIGMIRELSAAIRHFSQQPGIRVIIINAHGENFSAGADLQWMKSGMDQTRHQLENESKELAMLFNDIHNSPKVTVAVARGKVIGGANGIVAAADITLAAKGTTFMFSEVRLGLVPATIAPYIVNRTGKGIAQEWMLTGRPIGLEEALMRGLVHRKLDEGTEDETGRIISMLQQNGPEAMKGIKELFKKTALGGNPDQLLEETAKLIALYRTSPEGQEGMKAFFEKRQPGWRNA